MVAQWFFYGTCILWILSTFFLILGGSLTVVLQWYVARKKQKQKEEQDWDRTNIPF